MMNPLVPQTAAPMYLQPAVQQPILADDNEAELSSYLNVLYDNRWLIATITLVVGLLGAVYAFTARPVYEANMMIVEEQGQREAKNILGETGALFDIKQAATGEMELVKSRLVVSRAIDNLKLYMSASPKYFPGIGKWVANQNRNNLTSPELARWGGYSWGGEKIDLGTFNVPDALLNREFVLTAQGGGRYTVSEKESGISFEGVVGKAATVSTPRGNIEIEVASLQGNEGAQFLLTRSSRLAAIESVQNNMTVAEQGKQSGVIDVTLKGDDPQFVYNVLTAITNEYVRQNTSRKTEEADKSLTYINKQMPELKAQLEQAEQKYNSFRNQHGTIDLNEEGKLALQQASAAKTRRIDLEQKRTELFAKYTSAHPVV